MEGLIDLAMRIDQRRREWGQEQRSDTGHRILWVFWHSILAPLPEWSAYSWDLDVSSLYNVKGA